MVLDSSKINVGDCTSLLKNGMSFRMEREIPKLKRILKITFGELVNWLSCRFAHQNDICFTFETGIFFQS